LKNKTKDISENELKEHRRQKANKYYSKKKNKKEDDLRESISRKVKGKAVRAIALEIEEKEPKKEKYFSSLRENSDFLLNPGPNRSPFIFKKHGLEVLSELFTVVSVTYIAGDSNRAKIKGLMKIHAQNSKDYYIIRNIWEHDITEYIKKITSENYSDILNKITSKKCEEISKMKTVDYMKYCIENSKDSQDIAIFLWNALDDNYRKNKNMELDDLVKFSPKKVKKIK
jgi:hypothetical protein